MRGQRRLHVVRVVLDIVVLQDRLQSSSLLFPTLLWARDLCRQSVFGDQRVFSWRQIVRFDDLVACMLHRYIWFFDGIAVVFFRNRILLGGGG